MYYNAGLNVKIPQDMRVGVERILASRDSFKVSKKMPASKSVLM